MWSIDDKSWELIDRELSFSLQANLYRISAQPIPEWSHQVDFETKETEEIMAEGMNQESTQEPKEEIPHREARRKWHEDMARFYKTGGMTVWQFRRKPPVNKNHKNEWFSVDVPTWRVDCEYRRKPKIRKISYWHCLYENDGEFYTYAELSELHEIAEIVIRKVESFEIGNNVVACYQQVVEVEDKIENSDEDEDETY